MLPVPGREVQVLDIRVSKVWLHVHNVYGFHFGHIEDIIVLQFIKIKSKYTFLYFLINKHISFQIKVTI